MKKLARLTALLLTGALLLVLTACGAETEQQTALPKSEADEAIESWRSKTKDWSYCSEFGPDWDYDENAYILSTKVPANTPEGKTELLAALKDCPAFNISNCKHIGIAVVTIDGQMYWSCCMYY